MSSTEILLLIPKAYIANFAADIISVTSFAVNWQRLATRPTIRLKKVQKPKPYNGVYLLN
ncbi:MAG: hypothetical protein ACI84K_001996 [Pseudohongiellaceae bacterium]|jgi:hypothetical protein